MIWVALVLEAQIKDRRRQFPVKSQKRLPFGWRVETHE
jgi:hypothetical protein